MTRSLPKVCPFLVTVDLKLKWPELPRPTLPCSMATPTSGLALLFHGHSYLQPSLLASHPTLDLRIGCAVVSLSGRVRVSSAQLRLDLS